MSTYSDKLTHVQVVLNCLYSVAQRCTGEDMLVHYSDKLTHVQVVINCLYSIEQMCSCEDTLAHNLGAPYLDDAVSQNEPTTMDWQLEKLLKKNFRRGFSKGHYLACGSYYKRM